MTWSIDAAILKCIPLFAGTLGCQFLLHVSCDAEDHSAGERSNNPIYLFIAFPTASKDTIGALCVPTSGSGIGFKKTTLCACGVDDAVLAYPMRFSHWVHPWSWEPGTDQGENFPHSVFRNPKDATHYTCACQRSRLELDAFGNFSLLGRFRLDIQ